MGRGEGGHHGGGKGIMGEGREGIMGTMLFIGIVYNMLLHYRKAFCH